MYKESRIKALVNSVLYTIFTSFICYFCLDFASKNPQNIDVLQMTLIIAPVLFIVSMMYQLGKYVILDAKKEKRK